MYIYCNLGIFLVQKMFRIPCVGMLVRNSNALKINNHAMCASNEQVPCVRKH